MLDKFDYTINSTDPNHYNRVYANLSGPTTAECYITITSLTTNCNIVVLSDNDYITVGLNTYVMTDDYTTMSADTLVELLNTLTSEDGLTFSCDYCNRISVSSSSSIIINDCSYNLSLMLGLANTTLPLTSVESNGTHKIEINEVGAYLSTPVLYLASNIGYNSYRNRDDSGYLTSMRILMKLNNSYSSSYPIFATNGDFVARVNTSDLSDARFVLIDANYKEITLLNPMYLTITIELIENAAIVPVSGRRRPKAADPAELGRDTDLEEAPDRFQK